MYRSTARSLGIILELSEKKLLDTLWCSRPSDMSTCGMWFFIICRLFFVAKMNSNDISTWHEESIANIHCEDRHAQMDLDSRIWRFGLWRFSFRVFSSRRRWGEDISSWKMQVFDEVKLIFADGVTFDAGCIRIETIRQGPWQAQTCHYSMWSDVICLTSWSPELSPNFFLRVLYDEWWIPSWHKVRRPHSKYIDLDESLLPLFIFNDGCLVREG